MRTAVAGVVLGALAYQVFSSAIKRDTQEYKRRFIKMNNELQSILPGGVHQPTLEQSPEYLLHKKSPSLFDCSEAKSLWNKQITNMASHLVGNY